MNYRVSDIIRAAKQIADLENSNFISWNENIRLVNEAWTTVHQKLINKGDMTFTNEVEITGGKQPLPEDFYQVLSVLDNCNTPVPRYSIGANNSQIWYKLVNNQIVVNGIVSAKLTYFTKPQFLTYPSETIDNALPLEDGETVRWACGNWVLTNRNVWDIKEASIVRENSGGAYYFVDSLGRTYLQSEKPIFYPDGRCFKLTQNTCTDPNCSIQYSDNIRYITFDGVYYYALTNNISVWEQQGGSRVAIETLTGYSSNITFFDNHRYYQKDGIAWVDDIPMWDATLYNGALYPLKIDLNTGYGLFTGNNKILSIAVDTQLNLPNNLYYNVLAYMLAYSYCCKQGKDASLVASQLNSNIETLLDTLTNDAFSQMKITNVYRGMR